jgi:hypothetical protein
MVIVSEQTSQPTARLQVHRVLAVPDGLIDLATVVDNKRLGHTRFGEAD